MLGKRYGSKKGLRLLLISLEAFLLPNRNRGEEGNVRYRSINEFSLIDLVDDRETCGESQREACEVFFILLFNQTMAAETIDKGVDHF